MSLCVRGTCLTYFFKGNTYFGSICIEKKGSVDGKEIAVSMLYMLRGIPDLI